MFKKNNKLEIIVKGMSCSHCVSSVKKSLLNIDGVKKVKVDLKTGKVVIEYVGTLEMSVIEKCINDLGYTLGVTL